MATLLLVEPMPDLQRSLVALLQARGYQVVTAANGAGALEILSRVPHPSAILLDVTEPIAGDATLIAALDHREIPVIVLSAVCGAHRELPARTVAVLIGRPIRTEVLLEIVGRVCRPPLAMQAISQAG